VIKTFRNKQLAQLWEGSHSKIDQKFHKRIKQRLDALDAATQPRSMHLPGFEFHGLQGKPKRYSVHVNGPWCITFEFRDGDAFEVDFEQYH
jgi:proteic killer suppression protein